MEDLHDNLNQILNQKEDKKEYNIDSSSKETTHEENSSYAIGTELLPTRSLLKPRPSTKSKPLEKNIKRDFEARRKRSLREDINNPQDSLELIKTPYNQEQIFDLTSIPLSQPITAAPNQNNVLTVDNLHAKQKTRIAPSPTNRRSKNLQPKWITQNQNIKIKCKSLYSNPNKHSMPELDISHKLQALVSDHKIKEFHPTPHGYNIVINEHINLHYNPHKNEITCHEINTQNTKEYINLAKELDIVSLDISEINREEQFQLYLEGKKQNVEMEGIKKELEEEFVREYTSKHLIPGFSSE